MQLTGEPEDQDTTTDPALFKLAPKVVAAAGLRSVLEDVLGEFADKTVAAGFADLDRYLGLWLHLGAAELQAVNPQAWAAQECRRIWRGGSLDDVGVSALVDLPSPVP